tara:strand:+ start:161 stop:577 length:417 start_codon:yes stop_codon:yes gene_type:complete
MPLTRIKSSVILDETIGSADITDGGVASVDLASNMVLTGTDSITLPKGTTAQRGTAADGKFRFNTTLNQFEGYSNSAWGAVGGGATGGGSDQVFIENDQTVTTDYTISTNKNAVSAGTLTVNSGVTVTVPSGARWVVV